MRFMNISHWFKNIAYKWRLMLVHFMVVFRFFFILLVVVSCWFYGWNSLNFRTVAGSCLLNLWMRFLNISHWFKNIAYKWRLMLVHFYGCISIFFHSVGSGQLLILRMEFVKFSYCCWQLSFKSMDAVFKYFALI